MSAPRARAEHRALCALARDERGAVQIEFMTAIVPLLSLVLSTVQIASLRAASIVTQQAAQRAVRVASVVLHDDPEHYGWDEEGVVTERRLAPVRAAAKEAIAVLGDPEEAEITLDRDSYGPNDMIRLKVQYRHSCNVPLGDFIACGLARERTLTAEAALPNQGAEFLYEKGNER